MIHSEVILPQVGDIASNVKLQFISGKLRLKVNYQVKFPSKYGNFTSIYTEIAGNICIYYRLDCFNSLYIFWEMCSKMPLDIIKLFQNRWSLKS